MLHECIRNSILFRNRYIRMYIQISPLSTAAFMALQNRQWINDVDNESIAYKDDAKPNCQMPLAIDSECHIAISIALFNGFTLLEIAV